MARPGNGYSANGKKLGRPPKNGFMGEGGKNGALNHGEIKVLEEAIKLKDKPPKKEKSFRIEIPEMKIGFMVLPIHGTSPLLMHKFSVKSREEMGKKRRGEAEHKKAPENPEEVFLESLYSEVDPKPYKKGKDTFARGKWFFPAGAFRKAAATAADQVGLRRGQVLKAFQVIGNDVRLECSDPRMRTDIARIGAFKTADLRYRGEFEDWSCELKIKYNANVITPGQIANLFNVAGFAVGIGDWRPEKAGSNGMFEVHGVAKLTH